MNKGIIILIVLGSLIIGLFISIHIEMVNSTRGCKILPVDNCEQIKCEYENWGSQYNEDDLLSCLIRHELLELK